MFTDVFAVLDAGIGFRNCPRSTPVGVGRDRREQDSPTGGRGEAPNCCVGCGQFGR